MNESSFIQSSRSRLSTRGTNIRLIEKGVEKAFLATVEGLADGVEKLRRKRDHGPASVIERMNIHSSNVEQKRMRGGQLTDARRQRLLDAALTLFAHRGYHGTSVPDVAKAAKVATGSVYNYFTDKNDLVNQVYREAKRHLKSTLLDGLAEPNLAEPNAGEHWFAEVWRRLSVFALAEPDAFRFLEMQDHVEYLDDESRALELSVLGPLFMAGQKLRERSSGPSIDVAIALLWGAFVGVVKAGRLGYLKIDEKKLAEAGIAAWRLIAPGTGSAAAKPTSRTTPPNRRKKGN